MYEDDETLKPIDYSKLRYVLYARKSTEYESKQLRSVDDQIAECEQLARRFGITLAKPYLRETKSAKMPNNRPVFNQMLKDIRQFSRLGFA